MLQRGEHGGHIHGEYPGLLGCLRDAVKILETSRHFLGVETQGVDVDVHDVSQDGEDLGQQVGQGTIATLLSSTHTTEFGAQLLSTGGGRLVIFVIARISHHCTYMLRGQWNDVYQGQIFSAYDMSEY